MLDQELIKTLSSELVLLVIRLLKILEDGTRLPKGEASVRIFNGRNPTIRVDVNEWFLMRLAQLDQFMVVRDTELLEKDSNLEIVSQRYRSCEVGGSTYFPRIWATSMTPKLDWFERAHLDRFDG